MARITETLEHRGGRRLDLVGNRSSLYLLERPFRSLVSELVKGPRVRVVLRKQGLITHSPPTAVSRTAVSTVYAFFILTLLSGPCL